MMGVIDFVCSRKLNPNLAVSEAGVGQAFVAGVSRDDFLEPKRDLEEGVGFRRR